MTADWLTLASGLELRRFVGEGGLSASADVFSSPHRREQRTLASCFVDVGLEKTGLLVCDINQDVLFLHVGRSWF